VKISHNKNYVARDVKHGKETKMTIKKTMEIRIEDVQYEFIADHIDFGKTREGRIK